MSVVWDWITGGVNFLVGSVKVGIGSIVARLLGAFGLTVVSFNSLLPNIKAFIQNFISGIPAEALNLLGALGVGQAMAMIASAYVVKLAWRVWIVPTSVANNLPGAPS